MPNTSVKRNSLLAIDIGTINTRAAYFDVVEGKYRFISVGQSLTTSNAPVCNVMIGVQLAIENLQEMIGKSLMDDEGHLITPAQPDGLGVDNIVTSISLGPTIKTMIIGLLPDVSLKSIKTLAQTANTNVVDCIQLNDPRSADEQVDAIIRNKPDLVLIAGGIDGGAINFIRKKLEVIGLGIFLAPEENPPAVLFAGNKQLGQEVITSLNNIASRVYVCPNIRPSMDVEDLAPAQRQLANIVLDLRLKQMPQLDDIRMLSGGSLVSSSYAQGRMTRFLSSYFGSGKGVLSVDIGASAITMSASFDKDLQLNVFPQLGVGQALGNILEHTNLDEIVRWLPVDISSNIVRDYLYQKSIYPSAIPVTNEELAIEQAIIRQNLFIASRWMRERLPARFRPQSGLLPTFEPILAGGTAITNAANSAQKLLMLLDGLQPVGITTLALDPNNMVAILGAIAEVNPLLVVQALDAGILSYLATVISPISDVGYGTPIVSAKLIRNDGAEMSSEIRMGSLQILPLENRQAARLQLRPLQNADVGLGFGRAGEVDVIGSSIGIVIDARGRPLQLPVDTSKRQTLAKKWLNTLGG